MDGRCIKNPFLLCFCALLHKTVKEFIYIKRKLLFLKVSGQKFSVFIYARTGSPAYHTGEWPEGIQRTPPPRFQNEPPGKESERPRTACGSFLLYEGLYQILPFKTPEAFISSSFTPSTWVKSRRTLAFFSFSRAASRAGRSETSFHASKHIPQLPWGLPFYRLKEQVYHPSSPSASSKIFKSSSRI